MAFWREHQHEFPTLASAARDIFSIPATGAGVERLFNSARDICRYRRGSLNATTIQDIMMFRCLTNFDIESDELIQDDRSPEGDDWLLAEEQKEMSLPNYTPDPISDDEESVDESEAEVSLIIPAQNKAAMNVHRQRALGKRRRSVTSETDAEVQQASRSYNQDSDDDDASLPLPPLYENSSTQIRTSGRVRKHARRDQGDYEYF